MTDTTKRAPGSSELEADAEAILPRRDPYAMEHREILEALFGILAALFTALLSTTIVANALPTIIGDLKGTEHQYAWVITAALLANAASTPIWGKLSDLYNKKMLIQLAIVIFVAGSITAGFATSVSILLTSRVIQGLGMGGLMALSMSIIGSIIPPRERGRYQGYMGGTMAVAQAGGPILGGFIVDSLGWRWTFFVCVPLAIVALFVLQTRLRVPTLRREVHIDWLGSVLMVSTVSALLIWVSFAGSSFNWLSWQSALFVVGGVLGIVLTIIVEKHVAEPVIPIDLIMTRTTGLAVLASVAVGISLFGATTFLSQYFQLARAHTPTEAGLLQIPLVIGMLVASTVTGALITRFGAWKRYLVAGAAVMTLSLGSLGILTHSTPMWLVLILITFVGIGTGMLLQNLVLAVQNSVALKDVGTASSAVAFFRTFGGAIGVSVLGAVLASRVTSTVADRLAELGVNSSSATGGSTLDLTALPGPIQQIVRAAYGDSTGFIFAIAAIVSVVTLIAVIFIPNTALRRTIDKKETPADAEFRQDFAELESEIES